MRKKKGYYPRPVHFFVRCRDRAILGHLKCLVADTPFARTCLGSDGSAVCWAIVLVEGLRPDFIVFFVETWHATSPRLLSCNIDPATGIAKKRVGQPSAPKLKTISNNIR